MDLEQTAVEAETSAMEQIQQKKSGKKLLIIVGIILVIAIAGIITVVRMQKSNPITAGITLLKKELDYYSFEEGSLLGLRQAYDLVTVGDMQAKYSVNIGKIDYLRGATLGVDGEFLMSRIARKSTMSAELSASRVPIGTIEMAADAKQLYFSCPSIFDGSVVVNTRDIDGQWNASSLSEITGIVLDEDIDLQFFPDGPENVGKVEQENTEFAETEEAVSESAGTEDVEKEESGAEFVESETAEAEVPQEEPAVHVESKASDIFEKLGKELKGMAYHEISEKDTEETGYSDTVAVIRIDGSEMQGKGYKVQYGKLREKTAYVYLDSKGRIIKVISGIKGSDIVLEYVFSGVERTLDQIEILISGMTTKEELLQLMGKTKVVGAGTLNELLANLETEEQAQIAADILLEAKEQKYVISLEDFALYRVSEQDNDVIINASGEVILEGLQKNIVLPDGEQYRILEMDLMELVELVYSWRNNLSGLLRLIF